MLVHVSLLVIVLDLMHCLELGVLQVLIPSIMSVLLRLRSRRYPGTTIAKRYGSAYIRYRRYCTKHIVRTIVKKKFTPKVWGTGKKTGDGYPHISQLAAKAAGLRSMMYWMQEECRTDLEDETSLANGIPAHGTPAAEEAYESIDVHLHFRIRRSG